VGPNPVAAARQLGLARRHQRCLERVPQAPIQHRRCASAARVLRWGRSRERRGVLGEVRVALRLELRLSAIQRGEHSREAVDLDPGDPFVAAEQACGARELVRRV